MRDRQSWQKCLENHCAEVKDIVLFTKPIYAPGKGTDDAEEGEDWEFRDHRKHLDN